MSTNYGKSSVGPFDISERNNLSQLVLILFPSSINTILFKIANFVDIGGRGAREAVLFGPKRTASHIKKHRFSSRKAVLYFSRFIIC